MVYYYFERSSLIPILISSIDLTTLPTLKFLFTSMDNHLRLMSKVLACLSVSDLLSFISTPVNMFVCEILLSLENNSSSLYLFPFVDSIHLLMFVIWLAHISRSALTVIKCSTASPYVLPVNGVLTHGTKKACGG